MQYVKKYTDVQLDNNTRRIRGIQVSSQGKIYFTFIEPVTTVPLPHAVIITFLKKNFLN